jgi:hypothetical protein
MTRTLWRRAISAVASEQPSQTTRISYGGEGSWVKAARQVPSVEEALWAGMMTETRKSLDGKSARLFVIDKALFAQQG